MTAWHDQPPLSRRQARQNQRNEAESSVAQLSGEVPLFPVYSGGAQDDAAPESPTPPSRPRPGGRRALREAAQPALPQAEPLEYQTQGRPQVPSYDGPSFGGHQAAPAPEGRQAPLGESDETPRQPYRVRDFSPEGRRSAFRSTTPETPGSAPLEYHTQGAPVPPPAAYITPVPPAPAETPVPQATEGQTMTRRELRALRQAQDATQAPAPEASDADSEQRFASALAESDALAGQRAEEASPVVSSESQAAPAPEESVAAGSAPGDSGPTDPASVGTPAALEPEPIAEPQPAPESEPVAEPQSALKPEPAIEPGWAVQSEPAAVAEPVAAPVRASARQPAADESFEAVVFPPSDAEVQDAPAPYTPPVGHWSTQADIDDGEQFSENTLSRNVAATSGALTTNALVLPSIPSVDPLRPLGNTGEILITGTIDLPHSLGSTGAQPGHYEKSDVDALIEAGDHDESAPDSAPVRAIRAVSTHSSTRGVIQTKKPKSSTRLPIVLAVAAAAMAVGVVVIFVAGMIFKVF